MTHAEGARRTDIGRRELVGVLIACGLLTGLQWMLAYRHLAPSPVDLWILLLGHTVGAFWIFGLAGTAVAALVLARSNKEAYVTALLGLAVFAVAFVVAGPGDGDSQRLLAAAKWFGLYGLCALAYQTRRPGGLDRFLTVICFSLFVPISTAYLGITDLMRPQTLDLYAYSFDLSLGGNVAPYLFVLFHRSWLISDIAITAYQCILGGYVVLFALQSRFTDRLVVPALRVFLVAAILGFCCYFVFPIVGPKHFFGANYPFSLPGFADFSAGFTPAVSTARNGMPSLHFAWALLLVLNVPRQLPYAKAAFALFCILTFLATMGTGEHFFVDLIAALPFAATVQALGSGLSGWTSRSVLRGIVRPAGVFVVFLLLIALDPGWLHGIRASWAITAMLVVHFVMEIRWQRQTWARGEMQAVLRGPNSNANAG